VRLPGGLLAGEKIRQVRPELTGDEGEVGRRQSGI
jgi:hypothetical protein